MSGADFDDGSAAMAYIIVVKRASLLVSGRFAVAGVEHKYTLLLHLEDELFGNEKGAGGSIAARFLLETTELCLCDGCQLVTLAVVDLTEGGLVLPYRARIVDAGDLRVYQSFFTGLGCML